MSAEPRSTSIPMLWKEVGADAMGRTASDTLETRREDGRDGRIMTGTMTPLERTMTAMARRNRTGSPVPPDTMHGAKELGHVHPGIFLKSGECHQRADDSPEKIRQRLLLRILLLPLPRPRHGEAMSSISRGRAAQCRPPDHPVPAGDRAYRGAGGCIAAGTCEKITASNRDSLKPAAGEDPGHRRRDVPVLGPGDADGL